MVNEHSDVSRHIPLYVGIFAALAVFTVLTVLASQLQATVSTHVAMALAIATVKGSLVVAIFMHLRWEKTAILWTVLCLCAVLFVALMTLPSLVATDIPPGVRMGTWG